MKGIVELETKDGEKAQFVAENVLFSDAGYFVIDLATGGRKEGKISDFKWFAVR